MNGYILVSRNIIESQIWAKPPMYLKVFLYLLSRAQYKPYNGLERGQVYTSIPEIRDACSHFVGYRKERPSKDQVYRILEWLRNPNERCYESNNESNMRTPMIATAKATHGMLVNILDYNVSQDYSTYESNADSNNEFNMKATAKNLRKQQHPNNINEHKEIQDNISLSQPVGYDEKRAPKEKPNKRVYESDSTHYKIACALKDFIMKNNPKHAPITESNLQSWANEARLMMEVDHRTKGDIWKVMKFSQTDDFWKSNILSMGKLRKQFDQLTLRAKNLESDEEPCGETVDYNEKLYNRQ